MPENETSTSSPAQTSQMLYDTISELAPSKDPLTALTIGSSAWFQMRNRAPDPFDAETCRLLSLAALEANPVHGGEAQVWRWRALSRYALTGWTEGVAAIIISRVFTALEDANSGYRDGRTLDRIVGSEDALSILDEVEYMLNQPPSRITIQSSRATSPTQMWRLFYEKRGFILLTLRRLDDALASYKLAADAATGNERGEAKVKAGMALVEYFRGHKEDAIQMTEEAINQCPQGAQQDIVAIAQYNLTTMLEGGYDLRPYEIL